MTQDFAALKRLRHFLLDLDGTIYLGQNVLSGAAEFIGFLRDTHRPHLFFTNNSSKSAREYADKLTAMGIPSAPKDVPARVATPAATPSMSAG